MANTENIEAKLCAYVDGELDAAGRAEIEAHLAANPQHRQLIDELRGQRDLLRDLPRATAPDDLLESVHSQLERSALLGSGDSDRSPADIAGRISPWPRIMSVAAVLAMAIGLFAVIYYVLPQNSARNREYATGVTRAPSGSAMPTTLMAERDKDLAKSKAPGASRDRLLDLEHTSKRAEDDLLARDDAGKLTGAPATRPDVFAKGGPIDETKTGAGKDGHSIPSYTNIFADAQTEDTVKNSASVPSDSLVMVVASADPSQAQGEVQKYLQDNKIRWESVTEPVPQLDLKESQAMSGSRLGNTQMRLKGGGSTETFAAKGGGEAGGFGGANAKQASKAEDFGQAKKESSSSDVELRQQLQQQKPAQQQQQQQQAQQEQIALAPPGGPPPSATTPKTASNAEPTRVYDLSPPAAPATSAPAQQQEADSSRKVQAQQELSLQSLPQADQSALQAQQLSQQPVQLQQQAAANQAGGMSSQVIVARGLTRRQVSELNSNLNTQNAGRVYNYRRSGDNFTPTSLPATAVATATPTPAPALTIAPGAATQGESETATVAGTPPTTQPTAGPAPAPAPAAAPAPTPTPSAPARELSVNGSKSTDHFARADVITTMPSLSPTTVPLEQKHFDALAKADQPKSTTMPTGQAFGAISAPTSQPASVAATGATTMAIVATTHPSSDERLDVVICIQPPGLVAGQVVELNGAAPATQPVIAPNAAVAPNTAATEPTAAEPTAAEPSPVPNDTPPSDDAK